MIPEPFFTSLKFSLRVLRISVSNLDLLGTFLPKFCLPLYYNTVSTEIVITCLHLLSAHSSMKIRLMIFINLPDIFSKIYPITFLIRCSILTFVCPSPGKNNHVQYHLINVCCPYLFLIRNNIKGRTQPVVPHHQVLSHGSTLNIRESSTIRKYLFTEFFSSHFPYFLHI